MQNPKNTKEKIIIEAAILFAKKGFTNVTIKEIAIQVGVRSSSLYHYFKDKETLFKEIIDDTKNLYKAYFERLERSMITAVCFKDVVDKLFAELLEVYEIHIYYCLSMVATEQIRDLAARNAFNNDIMQFGINTTKRMLDESVENGWVKPFNTEIIAIMLMNNVIAGNVMRMYEDMNEEIIYSPKEMYSDLKDMILSTVEIVT